MGRERERRGLYLPARLDRHRLCGGLIPAANLHARVASVHQQRHACADLCLRMDIYAIGPAGNSAAGSTTASGASGASGGFCGLVGIRDDANLSPTTITVGAAGSGTESSVTNSAFVSGTLDAGAGGNASTTTAGTAGVQSCNAVAIGGNSGVRITPTDNPGLAGSAGGQQTATADRADLQPVIMRALACSGGLATVSGGGGGAGTQSAGTSSSSVAGQVGGNGLPSGTPAGGVIAAASGNACGPAGTAAPGQEGAGGGGGAGWGTGVAPAAGCAGSAGDYFAGLTYPVASFGSGGGGAGGGGGNQTSAWVRTARTAETAATMAAPPAAEARLIPADRAVMRGRALPARSALHGTTEDVMREYHRHPGVGENRRRGPDPATRLDRADGQRRGVAERTSRDHQERRQSSRSFRRNQLGRRGARSG